MPIFNPDRNLAGSPDELHWLGTMKGGSVTIGRRQLAVLCFIALKHEEITLDKAREVLGLTDEEAEEFHIRAFGSEY